MLTKSNYIKYIQCYKYLWLCKKRRDLMPKEIKSATQRIFDEGYEVEGYAYKLFPKGINAEVEKSIGKTIKRTKKLIKKCTKSIFQATVSGKNLFCKADIIDYNSKTKKWDIYEVKSSTQLKEIHIIDLAFQRISFEEAGYKIGKLNLVHINNQYVKKGKIIPKKLLKIENVTKDADKLIKEIKLNIKDALKILKSKTEPEIRILKQCNNPYPCDFIDYCWKHVPEQSIYHIGGGLSEKKLNMLLDDGILKIKNIPEGIITSKKGLEHYKAIKTSKVRIDKAAIKKELKKLKYPLYFLDYETFSPAIPLFDGYKPYQRMTFQYSLHVREAPKAKIKHFEYLAKDWQDPSLRLAQELKKSIGTKGTIITWNMGFEKGCNKEMGERYSKFKKFFEQVNTRVYDLMDVFRKGYYVHKNFQGSASIKKVLPALVPRLSHKNLNVQEGNAASGLWGAMINIETSEKEKGKIYNDLLKYCELDTLAMVEILSKLEKISK